MAASQIRAQVQDTEPKNEIADYSLYASLGTVFVYAAVTGNVERKFAEGNGFFKNYYAKVSYGEWGAWGGDEGTISTIGVTAMTGVKNSHLEVNAGITRMVEFSEYMPYPSTVVITEKSVRVLPSGSLDYRFQVPKTSMVFRAGGSMPETVHISLGFAF